MRRIPHFQSFLCRPSWCLSWARCWRPADRRSPDEPEVWAAHLAVLEGEAAGEPQFETDRARFLGRGNGVASPISISSGRPLSNTVGTVLDPIFSIRRRVRIPPGATVRVSFWTLLARSRDDVIGLADKHHDVSAFERAATLAWTQAQVQLHHLGVTTGRGASLPASRQSRPVFRPNVAAVR